MSDKDIYKNVFSRLHTSVRVDMEELQEMKRPVYKAKRRVAVLVAVALLVAAISTAAIASNLFGLQSLIISKNSPPPVSEVPTVQDDGISPITPEDEYTPPPVEIISLQGFAGSPEFAALAEWYAFLEGYDVDGEIITQVGNNPTGLPEKYNFYNVYTQEMADTLDAIASKHGLSLHSELTILDSRDELMSQIAEEGFISGDGVVPFSGYVYEDGTFKFDGDFFNSESEDDYIPFEFIGCRKGTFTDIYLNISSFADYSEWVYKTACGMNVVLSQSEYKSLLILELEDRFVTINVLCGSGSLSAADLETFADSFDFTKIK